MVNSIQRFKFQSTVIAAAFALLPLGSVHAAGLGKLTVMSALGQPLRAELEISASREELASLSARVASAETFRQAGVEYLPTASAFRFAVDKRAGGQPYLRVTSDRAINEPFLDVLIELVWSSGRMVREYTVLLDPPDLVKPKAPVAVEAAPVVASPVVAPPPPVATRAPAVAAAEPPVATTPEKPAAAAVPPPAQPVVTETPPAQKSGAATHLVGKGDTLAKIAAANKIEGINLDQMLVALFRANEDAFAGGNMNRLRVGKILNLPDREAVGELTPAEARKVIVSQAEDFNAYRQKLASAVSTAKPAAEEAPKQAAEGKITPKVEEKTPPPPAAKDKLEVSRTESAKEVKAAKDANKALQGRVTALEEDLVARDRALKEASSRVADLEKNLADLKKLAELKSQTIAQLQQQAAAKPAPEVKKPEPAPAVKPAEVPPAKPVEVAKAPEPVPAPVEPPKAAEVPKPVEPEKAAEPPKPEVKAPEVKKVEPPPEEPSFLDDNPELVYGGGGVLAILLGYLGFAAMRRKRDVGTPTTSRISEGDLMANSVFGSTGGQAVDTGASIQTDFSQANLAAISADEGVDPVAEADVYMAYGRDAQAEEILLDALKNDPARHAIYLKLLEIYSSRKSLKQFEAIARDLHAQTAGNGPDWERAAAMGRTLDPDNAFYGQGDGAAPVADMSATTIIVPPTQAEKLRDAVEAAGQPVLPPVAPVAEVDASAGLDFDLDVAALASAGAKSSTPDSLDFEVGETAEAVETGADLGRTIPMPATPAEPPAPAAVSDLDFQFDLGDEAAPVTEDDFSPNATHLTRVTDSLPGSSAAVDTSLAATQLSKALTRTHLDFEDAEPNLPSEVSEPSDEFSPSDTHGNRAMTETHLDLGGIDLNLDATMPMPHAQPAGGDVDDPDVATKIELAQAYEEMGDKEGARELLQEVLQEGSSRQREQARSRLASLGG